MIWILYIYIFYTCLYTCIKLDILVGIFTAEKIRWMARHDLIVLSCTDPAGDANGGILLDFDFDSNISLLGERQKRRKKDSERRSRA